MHIKRTVRWAASIATAAIPAPLRRKPHTSIRVFPKPGQTPPTRSAPIPCSTTNRRNSFVSSIRRSADRPSQLWHDCHPREVLRNRKSMMTHGCMLWGAALYNNGSVPVQAGPRSAKATACTGVPQRIANGSRRRPTRETQKGVVPYLDPLPRFEISQPGNILPHLQARRTISARDRHPGAARRHRPAADPFEQSRPGHRKPHRSRSSSPAENAPARSDAQFPRHQRPSRRLPLQRLHRLPCHLRQRPLAGPFRGLTPRAGNRGSSVQSRPDHSEERAGPSHRAPVRPRQRHPDQPVHRLPHPSRHQRDEQLPRLQWWDEETDGELMYPTTQKHPTAEQDGPSRRCSTPTKQPAAASGPIPPSWRILIDLNTRTRQTQFADFHGHGWISAPSTSRTQGQHARSHRPNCQTGDE